MKNAPVGPHQRQFTVTDPAVQPAYKVAQAHATENGRSVLFYRDFYVGHWDEDVAPVTESDMKRARRHFRAARGIPEGPDPVLQRELVNSLRDRGLLVTRTVRTLFGHQTKKIAVVRIPKRYRKI